jgi:hypothetical protein
MKVWMIDWKTLKEDIFYKLENWEFIKTI